MSTNVMVQPTSTYEPQAPAQANIAKLVLPDNSEITIRETEKTIGRLDFERVVSPEELKFISRQHIVIKTDGGRYYAEDLGSSNGTTVNGIVITSRSKWGLDDGDTINLADRIALQFKVNSPSMVIANTPQESPLIKEIQQQEKPSAEEIGQLNKQLATEYKQPKTSSAAWGYAKSGLTSGIYIGIGLKCLDTFIGLVQVDGLTAFLFLIAIGVCFIPKIGGGIAFTLAIAFTWFTGLNLFLMVLVAALAGAILGALPGMAIGSVVGLIKNSSNGSTESIGTIITSFVLPLLGGTGLLLVYFLIFNPWLASVLEAL